jgi:hypothetical protein
VHLVWSMHDLTDLIDRWRLGTNSGTR